MVRLYRASDIRTTGSGASVALPSPNLMIKLTICYYVSFTTEWSDQMVRRLCEGKHSNAEQVTVLRR